MARDDEGYRDQAMPQGQRIERLEEAVAKFSMRRFYETLRWGFIVFFGGLGIGATAFGASFFAEHVYEGAAEEALALEEVAQAEHIRQQENAELIPAEEQARERIRERCSNACQSAGLGIERARVIEDGDHWRAAQCSCVGPHGHRTLWNDLRSRESVLRSQCSSGCQEAGMGLSRVILRPHRGELRAIACACVDGSRHRALWDDRQSHQLCELHDGTLRCDLDEQPQEIQLTGGD